MTCLLLLLAARQPMSRSSADVVSPSLDRPDDQAVQDDLAVDRWIGPVPHLDRPDAGRKRSVVGRGQHLLAIDGHLQPGAAAVIDAADHDLERPIGNRDGGIARQLAISRITAEGEDARPSRSETERVEAVRWSREALAAQHAERGARGDRIHLCGHLHVEHLLAQL